MTDITAAYHKVKQALELGADSALAQAFAANKNVLEPFQKMLPDVPVEDISSTLKDCAIQEAQQAVQKLLSAMLIDTKYDHNTQETAKRVAKMMVSELYGGRFDPMPRITRFPNASDLDELFTIGPIQFVSTCSHHMIPIIGKVWIGVMPGKEVIGLSKYARVAKWILSRPHIQEEAAVMLADAMTDLVDPLGLGIVIKATHQCMTCRGVRESHESSMVNSIVRGALREDKSLKKEFFDLIKTQGF